MYFITISILNPKEYLYNKCHRLSVYVSKNDLFIVFGHFGAKWADIFTELFKTTCINTDLCGILACTSYQNAISK
jgi:hypothetical protein